jgi:hypothetical protein
MESNRQTCRDSIALDRRLVVNEIRSSAEAVIANISTDGYG